MRGGWVAAIVTSAIASGVAMELQTIARDVWQVRTLPERVMEWLLLFVPLDLFERALGQLGSNAKEVGLAGAVFGMAVAMIVIGTLALRAGWGGGRLLSMGLGMWVLTMAVVMPITGAGFFATGLLISPWLTGAAYLMVFTGYASVLAAGRLLLDRRSMTLPRQRVAMMAERRALIAGVVGAAAAAGLARYVGRDGGLVSSSLPLASAPTVGPNPTEPVTDSPAGVVGAAPVAVDTPAPVPTPTVEPLPNPPAARALKRDNDGSLTAAGRRKGELAPLITANPDFYIVTKNAVADPVVDAASWRLVLEGEVNRPVQLDYRTLRALPAIEVTKTLECISNFTAGCNLTAFGCDLISTARFRGAPLAAVLDVAGGLKPSAVGLACVSADEFSAGLPVSVVEDPETLVVYEMNGEPLPREHGFPARLLVAGRYGMKNPKWLVGIRGMTQEFAGWYEQRNWNKDGIVKTMARIDVPVDGSQLAAGEQSVAGIAYAGDRGLRLVEVSIDNSQTWQPARILEPMTGKDALVRWETAISLARGQTLTIVVRATDGTGAVQTDEFRLPQPDGASGRDQVTISAA